MIREIRFWEDRLDQVGMQKDSQSNLWQCPARNHQGRNPTLCVTTDERGSRFECLNGCPPLEVVAARKFEESQLSERRLPAVGENQSRKHRCTRLLPGESRQASALSLPIMRYDLLLDQGDSLLPSPASSNVV